MLTFEQERRVLAERVAKRISLYSDVKRVIYFGSGARGEADSYSDIDVCYTTEALIDRQKFVLDTEIRADLKRAEFRLGQGARRIDLSYVSEEAFQNPEEYDVRLSFTEFIDNIIRDGITLWPKSNTA